MGLRPKSAPNTSHPQPHPDNPAQFLPPKKIEMLSPPNPTSKTSWYHNIIYNRIKPQTYTKLNYLSTLRHPNQSPHTQASYGDQQHNQANARLFLKSEEFDTTSISDKKYQINGKNLLLKFTNPTSISQVYSRVHIPILIHTMTLRILLQANYICHRY